MGPQPPASGARGERLQKLLAAAGLGSRRQIEQWIRDGRVQIDGAVASLGARATADTAIRLDGRPVTLPALVWGAAIAAVRATAEKAHGGSDDAGRIVVVREVLLYHKPAGEVTTRSDPQGRPTVFDRLPAPRSGGRWVVIGRLDVNTTGLLLFTTDGSLAHRWMHPSAQIEREYLVRVRGQPDSQDLDRLRKGLMLEDGPARFEGIRPAQGPTGPVPGSHTWYLVALREGRNREVRRLWQAAGFEVSRLKRMRFGNLELPLGLTPGQWQWLSAAQAEAL